jgi:hypothetical protein
MRTADGRFRDFKSEFFPKNPGGSSLQPLGPAAAPAAHRPVGAPPLFSLNRTANFCRVGAVLLSEANDPGTGMSRIRRYWKQTMTFVNRCALWSDRHLPRGVRAVLGVLAMACGVLGFLPILGFWMFPLGVVLVALDIPLFRRRVLKWLARQSG